MTFTKAKPQQSRLRLSLYGPPGSGKTFSSLLIAEGLAKHDGKRIAFVDTEESGTDFYALPVAERESHPEAFDFDILRTQSLADVARACKSLDPETHGVIVIDSITHLWEAAMNAAEHTKRDTVKFSEWSKIKKPYKALVKWLMESPFHVILCGRQKNVFEEDSKGDLKKVGVTMNAERDTAYEPQLCIRLDPQVNAEDTTLTKYMAYVEKDRSGVLSGRTLCNLKFDHFAPILGLLGDEQVKLASDVETSEKDAEYMEDFQHEEERERQARIASWVDQMCDGIGKAESLDDLRKAKDALTAKRGMLTKEQAEKAHETLKGRVAALKEDTDGEG